MWDFLSEASEAYGPASDVGFFKGLVRDANTSVRRAVGDRVDEIDTWRRKIISAMPPVSLPEAPWVKVAGGSNQVEASGAEALLGRGLPPAGQAFQVRGEYALGLLSHLCCTALCWYHMDYAIVWSVHELPGWDAAGRVHGLHSLLFRAHPTGCDHMPELH